jgi:hypothetical protein
MLSRSVVLLLVLVCLLLFAVPSQTVPTQRVAFAALPSNLTALSVLVPQSARQRRATASQPPLGDYVPCLFDDTETSELRAIEKPKLKKDVRLDASNAEAVAEVIRTIIVGVATPPLKARGPGGKKAQAENLTADQAKTLKFSTTISADQFINKLPGEVPAIVKSLTEDKTVQLSNEDKDHIVKAAKAAISGMGVGSTFNRPSDVSCSFSVLQWQETSDNFGRRVANDYVAIQVTVRNLNKQTEFLIHDIQIAVDTGLDPRQFGRFEAARDKLMVRNVAQRGQSEDRRNLIINTLQAAGAIAGGASTAVTQSLSGSAAAVDLASAVAIFQGPFITGVLNIFPDHTLENINHINDLAFSASSTSKTVVPIQGSIPLVTFLSERPLEQLPFAFCGSATRKGHIHAGDPTLDADDPGNPGSINYPFCTTESEDITKLANSRVTANYYMKPLPFRRWSPAAIEVLQRRVFVVVGGVHIQELPNNPQVTDVTCPMLGDGTIDLSKADSSGNISCILTGTQLNKAASIKLEQPAIVRTGTLMAASDGSSATITFKAADFTSAANSYELFLTDSSGIDLDTNRVLNFSSRQSNVTGVAYSPGTLSAASASTPLTATISGTNLDRIASVSLSCCGTSSINGTIQTVNRGATTMVVQFQTTDVTTLIAKLAGSGAGAQLQFTTVDNPTQIVTVAGSTIH